MFPVAKHTAHRAYCNHWRCNATTQTSEDIMSDFKPGSLSEQLETLLDKHGLMDVLIALECLCTDKADHIRINWQDNSLAREWDKYAKLLQTLARKVTI
jgi:hypothetical protein